jgi:deoxyribodipyrimidine photo-lyase
MEFETDKKTILEKIDRIDPVLYGKTRNHVDGAVTRLSPYISRGVISTKQVLENVLKRGYKIPQITTFIRELCWRDHFQRVGQAKDLDTEIRQAQTPVSNHGIPALVVKAATGITGIDTSIEGLYRTGYMHNHCRMYTASLVCNIARSHWHEPARWMYYHLLDGDWASNVCSWQWVAGANSHKKYYADQSNINKYTNTAQRGTFLDEPYDILETMEPPAHLMDTQSLPLSTELPASSGVSIRKDIPTFIYNYYNLDPFWHRDEPGNRILLLEPGHFKKYPVSKKCIDFMLALSRNISGIQIYTGSFGSLINEHQPENICYKEHPLNFGYAGHEEQRDWIAENITGYHPSFFAYWKKMEKQLYKGTRNPDDKLSNERLRS